MCGHLSLAFCGHRNDSQFHPEVGSYSKGGVGNIVGTNQSSKRTSQNKLIKCCSDIITDKIIADLKASKFYSRDISNRTDVSCVTMNL